MRRREPVPDPTPEAVAPFIRAVGPIPIVNLGGGEPFLRDDLPAICALFPSRSGISIPTSGWRADAVVSRTRAILDVVPVKRLSLAVSIDGFRKTNDAIRGAGTYDRALETLRALIEIPGLRVKVNTVLTSENADELIDFMQFVQQEGPCFHSILLVRGEPRDPACGLPPLDELARIAPRILDIQRAYEGEARSVFRRVARNYLHAMWDVSLRTLGERRQVVPCLTGRAHLVLYANGDVAPCELLPPVGNIFRDATRAILRGAALSESVGRIRAGACWCTHNCNLMENILFSPRKVPALLGFGTKRPPGGNRE